MVDCNKKNMEASPYTLNYSCFFQAMYFGDFDLSDRLRHTDHDRYFIFGSNVTTHFLC